MHFEATKIYANIDPYFQRLLERRQRGLRKPYASSTGVDEIAVIARVSDINAWENLSEVRVGATIGQLDDGSSIVTARIPTARIEAVRTAAPVVSLKPAKKLRPLLDAGTAETKARSDLLPAQNRTEQGSGVVIGIVDFGCDFAHDNFRNEDGTTRILSIWDQNDTQNPSGPFGYGRAYDSNAINHALDDPDPYVSLGYGPAEDSPFSSPGTHGTHVMDISAGNGRGSGTPGMAPNADIVFVEVAASDIPWGGAQAVGSSFGDSVQLLEAVKYIFDQAGDRPCVVNLSLGTNGGPHDGSTLVEQGIDSLLKQQDNRVVTIAASNSYSDGIHSGGEVTQGNHTDVSWVIPNADSTDNELEIWYHSDDIFKAELITPGGDSVGMVDLGTNGVIRDDNGEILLFVSHRNTDPNNGDNTVGIYLERRVPDGVWTVRLHGEQINNGTFHAWIERDDRAQSSFQQPHDNTHTLGSISCGQKTIVVGSYDAHKGQTPLSWFSSAGPTRDGRQKPEISAPGHDVAAAHSRTGTGVTRKSGTSMASPGMAGIAALVLAEARARQLNLSIDDLRQIIQETAQPQEGQGEWDDRYGAGHIDAAAAINNVINRS